MCVFVREDMRRRDRQWWCDLVLPGFCGLVYTIIGLQYCCLCTIQISIVIIIQNCRPYELLNMFLKVMLVF